MDTELFYRSLNAGARWGHLAAYIAGFRQHGGSKGIAAPGKWAGEYDVLDRGYPQYHARTVKHYLGRGVHKAIQWLSGREPAGRRDTRNWRGKTVEAVFGPWVTQRRELVDNSDSTIAQR
jgi:hypothetical protein